jgi:hypothetical protein
VAGPTGTLDELSQHGAHAGVTCVEIAVTNQWVNRTIGDQQPDTLRRHTFTTMPFYTAASSSLRSGLLGPVRAAPAFVVASGYLPFGDVAGGLGLEAVCVFF